MSNYHNPVDGIIYNTVAASQTAQKLSATSTSSGGAGDYLAGLLVVPTSTSPAAITITDGTLSAITVFAGGSSSVLSLAPFYIPIGAFSISGAWQVTTGANESVVAFGQFS